MAPTLDEATAALTAATVALTAAAVALTAAAVQNPNAASTLAYESDVRFLPIIDSINNLQYEIENDANIQIDAKNSIIKKLKSIGQSIVNYSSNLKYTTDKDDVLNAILGTVFVTQSLLRQENRNIPLLPSTFSVNTFLAALLTGLIK